MGTQIGQHSLLQYMILAILLVASIIRKHRPLDLRMVALAVMGRVAGRDPNAACMPQVLVALMLPPLVRSTLSAPKLTHLVTLGVMKQCIHRSFFVPRPGKYFPALQQTSQFASWLALKMPEMWKM